MDEHYRKISVVVGRMPYIIVFVYLANGIAFALSFQGKEGNFA